MTITSFVKYKYLQQPKREIVEFLNYDYKNILTPRLYEDYKLYDFIRKNKGSKVFLRSEHPLELEGDSGILGSYTLDYLVKNNFFNDDKKKVIDLINKGTGFFVSRKKKGGLIEILKKGLFPKDFILDYVNLIGKDFDDFVRDVSYSNWEYINGINGMIIADDVVEDRYHIILSENGIGAYIKLNNTFVEEKYSNFSLDDINFLGIKDMYNLIRDEEDCPMVEFQLGGRRNKDIYFLQYHKSREFKGVDFRLDRSLKDGEVEANFVRGKTPREGLELSFGFDFSNKESILEMFPHYTLEDLVNSKYRKAQVFAFSKNNVISEMIEGHFGRSLFYKPELSIGIDLKKLDLDELEVRELVGGTGRVNLRVISDGRKSYVKRI